LSIIYDLKIVNLSYIKMCTSVKVAQYAKIYSSKLHLLVAIVNMENEVSHIDVVSRSITVK